MEIMMTISWVGVMLLIGMVCRATVSPIRKALVPSSVIAGVLGFVLINTVGIPFASSELLTTLVSELFVISFISIGLTGSSDATVQIENKKNEKKGNSIVKGSLGLGLVWCIIYAVTPVVSVIVLMICGKPFDIDPIYGLLIPFAFAQGPGQAATYGGIFESYGIVNGAMVGVTFAALGFVVAFLVGVPMAKMGLKKGLAKHKTIINDTVTYGVFKNTDDQEKTCAVTCHSGNIDTLAFHMALVGLTYILTYYSTWVFAKLLGPLGDTMWGMMFMNGMMCGYLIKFVMKKLKIEYIHDNETQKRISGFATDFLVAASFMAVEVSIIGRWIVPIILCAIAVAGVTYVICVYFGQRLGGEYDFERTLGLWGTATGTVPSGIGLVRIIDPSLSTPTAIELGGMNLPMLFSTPTVVLVLAMAGGTLKLEVGIILLLVSVPFLLLALKLLKLWNKKTYSFYGKNKESNVNENSL